MLIGAHVSLAGGLAKAAERGVAIGADAIQIFNQSPRMWKPTAYTEEDCAAFREACAQTGIKAVLIHAVYLLNCASEDPEIRKKSLASLIQSLQVGDAIGATGVVLHPGSTKGAELQGAIRRAGEVIAEALAESDHCQLHLEDTAGAGGTLGRSFEELASLIEAAGSGPRLGVCLDSCHLLASGYEVRSNEALSETIDRFDETVGLDRLGSIHLNDSLVKLGSNRDRHAAPGTGEFGEEGLAVFLSEPRFDELPCVWETGSENSNVTAADIQLARDLRARGQANR
jgi:deoxyribonuclease-4